MIRGPLGCHVTPFFPSGPLKLWWRIASVALHASLRPRSCQRFRGSHLSPQPPREFDFPSKLLSCFPSCSGFFLMVPLLDGSEDACRSSKCVLLLSSALVACGGCMRVLGNHEGPSMACPQWHGVFLAPRRYHPLHPPPSQLSVEDRFSPALSMR